MYFNNKFTCDILLFIIVSNFGDLCLSATISPDSWLDCAPIHEIANGSYKILEENNIPETSIPNYAKIKVKCNDNFVLSTTYDIISCIDGNWNLPIPECTTKKEKEEFCGNLHPDEAFPWHVGIYQKKEKEYQYICGGSIISKSVIITAAHCVENITASNIYIAAGKIYSDYSIENFGEQKKQVKEFIIPDNYNGRESYLKGDIAVLTLVTPLEYTSSVYPVCVDWENKFENEQLTDSNIGRVQGWGFTDIDTLTPSLFLMELNVPFVNPNKCLETVPSNFHSYVESSDKFCAGYTNGSCVCNGDDGGGLVFPKVVKNESKYYIRGLVSTYPTIKGVCDKYQYGVYTKISSYVDLIKDIVTRNKQNS